ncbi:hypothetical protein M2337_000523 [Sphingobium sp. B2D3A]|nr:hypothetical protein [Sphingobium sp. B2D3A]MCW2386045.1 hypothetical protein [Sphingobium sp. B2D3D]
MSLTIALSPASDALTFAGDVSRSVKVPQWPAAVALSDGTLLEVSPGPPSPTQFKVATAGAGLVVPQGQGVEVQWPVEWFTVSGIDQAVTVSRVAEPLPLFPETP